MRKLPATIAAAVLLVSLSACSAGPDTFAGCEAGSSAALVASDGSFPTPLISTSAEFSVVTRGDGAQVAPSDAVLLLVDIYDATSGQRAQDTVTLPVFVSSPYPFTSAMSCATVGSQVSTTGSVTDLLNPATPSDQQLVMLTTISQAFPGQATGRDQILPNGFPAIVFTPVGQPGFTFPDGAAPSMLTSAAMKQGSGATVKDGDSVVVNLTGISWGGTSTFISSWENQAPAVVAVTPLTDAGVGVVPGLAQALVGQQVGSRVVVLVPPGDGYPAAQLPTGVTDGDTLVFVVDILAID